MEVEYEARAARLTPSAWHDAIARFDDANIYQTWSYGDVRWGAENLRHHILEHDGRVVAAAQVALITLPVIGAGVAFVKWGPLWRVTGARPKMAHLREMLRHLGHCYANRLVLRIEPREIDDRAGKVRSLLAAEGYGRRSFPITYQTYLIDLSTDADVLRAGLKKSWRRRLDAARKQRLVIAELSGEAGVARFMELHREMRQRKRFVDETGLKYFPAYQAALPRDLRLRQFACLRGDRELAVFAVSVMGNTGMTLFAVTTPEGRRCGASYLLDWWVVTYLKRCGCRWYDIGGAGNPIIDQYKSGLAGRSAEVKSLVGYFDKSTHLLSRLTVHFGGAFRRWFFKLRKWLGRCFMPRVTDLPKWTS